MKTMNVLAGLAICSVAVAQTPPDVPESHWAAKAVSDLYRLGVLRGYPDRLYRGSRPVTRYELGEALNNFVGLQQKTIGGLETQIKELRPQPQSIEGLAQIRQRLDSLEANVASLESMRTDVQSLQGTFHELTEQLRKLREDLRFMRNKGQ